MWPPSLLAEGVGLTWKSICTRQPADQFPRFFIPAIHTCLLYACALVAFFVFRFIRSRIVVVAQKQATSGGLSTKTTGEGSPRPALVPAERRKGTKKMRRRL